MTEASPKYYNVNLGDKIRNSVTNVKNFKLDLEGNIADIKKRTDSLARKEINFNFIERFTRKLYTNDVHLVKLEMLQYILFIVLIYYYNPFNINTNFPVFTKLLVLAVSFIYVVLFIFIREKVQRSEDVDMINPTESNIITRFIATIVFFILFMFVIKGFIWVLMNTSLIQGIRRLMSFFIVMGILSIVYLFMKKSINKAQNAPGHSFSALLIKIIMYLPCLLVDIVEAIKYEFNLTTKPVWLLMGLESIFIGLFFLLPFLFDKVANSAGMKLLNAPVRLNKEATIGTYDQLYDIKDDTITPSVDVGKDEYDDENDTENLDGNGNVAYNCNATEYIDPNMPHNKYLAWLYTMKQKIKELYKKIINENVFKIDMKTNNDIDKNVSKFHYKYAISAWFNINPQPPNTNSAYGTYTNILNYGKKVSVEYNGRLNSLRVMAEVANVNANNANNDANVKNKIIQVYETKEVIYQKWNNIVINYDNGFIDVFLNGALVGSVQGVAPYMTPDSITIGAEKGIFGGICNVAYHPKPLSQPAIVRNYKALRGKDLPYVWQMNDERDA